MSGFLTCLALNPNINKEQFEYLAKENMRMFEEQTKVFKECMDSMETEEDKTLYFKTCFPILLSWCL